MRKNFVPPRIASQEPTNPPQKFAAANGNAQAHTICPLGTKKANAAKFVVKLITFAEAVAVKKSYAKKRTNTNASKLPVPGPKTPSYKPIAAPVAKPMAYSRRVNAASRTICPKSFLQNVYTSIASITANIAGFIYCTGTSDDNFAPKNEAANANTPAGNNIRHGTRTRRTNCPAAIAVPVNEANLFTPNTDGTGVLPGSKPNSAGICNNPPPPTAASINPAAKPATIKPNKTPSINTPKAA